MIPKILRLKGLYSYQNEQVIDFDTLLSAQIFGIFGAVGSGKSSILEAISFALYGQTERLSKADNRNYNMMNLKSSELLIDFEFLNYDEKRYRFVVKGKRHGKSFDKVNTFARSAYSWEEHQWVPLENTLAEPVLGLSYENFRRTIIIPQGKFQEFLQLGAAQRTQMLKEIFQLEKYEFFYQTRALEAKNSAALENLSGRLSTFQGLEQEEIQSRVKLLEQMQARLLHETELLADKRKVLHAQLQLKELLQQIQEQQSLLDALLDRRPAMEMLAVRLKEKAYCLQHFKPSLERKKERETDLEEKRLHQRTLVQGLEDSTKEIEHLRPQLEDAKREFLRQEEYKERLQDFEYLIQLVKLKASIAHQESRIQKGRETVDALAGELKEAELQRRSIVQEIQEKNRTLPSSEELLEVRRWFDYKASRMADLNELKQELQGLEQEKKQSVTEFQAKIEAEFKAAFPSCPLPEDLQQELRSLKATANAELDVAIGRHNQLRMQVRLGEFTEAIRRGEACPLCGSRTHESILEIGNHQLHILEAEKEIEEIKGKQQLLDRLETACLNFTQQMDFFKKQQNALKQKLDSSREGLENHLSKFCWPDFHPDDPGRVDAVLQQIRSQSEYIKSLYARQESVEEEISRRKEDYEKFAQALEKITSKRQAETASFQTYLEQLKQHQRSDVERFNEEVLQSRCQALRQKILNDKNRYEQQSKREAELQSQRLTHQARLEDLNAQIQQQEQALKQLREELESALERSSFDDWDRVEAILADLQLSDQRKEELEQYNLQLFSTQEKMNELQRQVQGQHFDSEAFSDLEQQVNNLEAELMELKETYIRQSADCQRDLQRLEEKKKLLKAQEDLSQRAEDIKVMRNLFTGNGFVAFISTVYLESLCHSANKRFYPLTHQQLRLELGANNEFLVRDFLNDGRLRSVKTLSGGQTFQASLCLALALAESVQQQNRSKQNFFFLDEGFGALDKDALQLAFATLKSLRKENRVVGIISHVEELQQEIDVYLKVSNHTLNGSIIQGPSFV